MATSIDASGQRRMIRNGHTVSRSTATTTFVNVFKRLYNIPTFARQVFFLKCKAQMARPSKVKSPKHAQFAVYTDNDIPGTPESMRGQRPTFDDDDNEDDEMEECSLGAALERNSIDATLEQEADESYEEDQSLLDDIDSTLLEMSANTLGEQTTDTDAEADDERRESAMTTASISSMPESTVFDADHNGARYPPYTPPSVRPTFRYPESASRRMQALATPTSFERSPKRLVLHGRTSRTGTPRSTRKEGGKSSRRNNEHKPMERESMNPDQFPLVLLHFTILPISLRWSEASMQEILPANIVRNLNLLRSKLSSTILQRGILVPHPRDEYDLLEERLLEALELKEERVTKCGHFRGGARISTGSTSSAEGSVSSAADSGVEIELDHSKDRELCSTCLSPVKVAGSPTGNKWSIKIYAANGLMRSSAWSAAWSEMERVDVEILPWISEELCKKLDAAMEMAEEEERARRGEEEGRIRQVVEEQVRIAHENEGRRRVEIEAREQRQAQVFVGKRRPHRDQPEDVSGRPPTSAQADPLPQVYRPADIPLSVLLRNYIYLLAQDMRNVAIFVLAVLAAWMSLAPMLSPPNLPLPGVPESFSTAALSVTSPGSGMVSSMSVDYTAAAAVGVATSAAEDVLEPIATQAMLEQEQETGPIRPALSSSVYMCRNPSTAAHLFGKGETISKATTPGSR